VSYLLVLGCYAILPESHSGLLWRIILGFGAVPALIIIAVRSRYMSESPVWAANQGDLEGAQDPAHVYGIDAVVAPTVVEPPKRPASWRNYGLLLKGVYARRTVLATVMSIASSFAYNAVAFGLPVIIASFLAQTMLTTILVSLALNLLFAFVGGLIGVHLVPKTGAWKLTVTGYAFQLARWSGWRWWASPGGVQVASRSRSWRCSCWARALAPARIP
jgi:hypothetical protein